MNPKHKTMAWLGGGVALVVVGTAVMFLLARSWTFEPPPPLVLSKETTWFTGPVREDGGIDWVAALEAEARAEGLKDEENGAPLLKEALVWFVDVQSWVEKSGTEIEGKVDAVTGNIDRNEEIERALEALGRGELDAPNVDVLLAWIEACGPALEKARLAAERPAYFLSSTKQFVHPWPTLDELPELHGLLSALVLRVAVHTARGDVDRALADTATACVLSRETSSPATFLELTSALDREVVLLRQLCRCVQSDPVLPADRVLAVVVSRPARWTGEAALKEAQRSSRLVSTSWFDGVRSTFDSDRIRGSEWAVRLGQALVHVDLNPHFRRLQGIFDDLHSRLFGSAGPARDRIDSYVEQLQRLVDAGQGMELSVTGSFELALLSDNRVVARLVDGYLMSEAAMMKEGCGDWLTLTARRDALMAELAARAGAPERRDSWLGEPLIVTRKEDGSIEIGGALIDLARERGAKDEE